MCYFFSFIIKINFLILEKKESKRDGNENKISISKALLLFPFLKSHGLVETKSKKVTGEKNVVVLDHSPKKIQTDPEINLRRSNFKKKSSYYKRKSYLFKLININYF